MSTTHDMKCLVCGKKTKGVKVKHGVMPVCSNQGICLKEVDLAAFKSVPVVWVGLEDFLEHDLITQEETKTLDILSASNLVQDYLWEATNLGEDFKQALKKTLEYIEEDRITLSKPEDLPLLIGTIKHEANLRLFSDRLKKGK